ncbi:MAG: SusC/RagA family TonB-linked outer membrane protein [Bacteroidetes bacterium]|nr:SusC/RagA family TonB-linked outer membrane protein [Bacteroidota bacterium]
MRLRSLKLRKSSVAVLLLLLLSPLSMMAQTKSVTGVVKDSKGEPVPNATVIVKGSKTGVATAANGTFTINAAPGATLLISAVNYDAAQIKIGTETSYTVVLTERQTVLSDVVVVGYGKGSRRTLSSSITTIKPEDLNKGAIGDVGQLLQGKVAGLNVSASGDPNKPAAVILRGASTINSPGGPFYVIDGVPGADISLIAPDDVASIDVLKDAAATAIYGNKAANGVIMVTTKRGKGGKPQTSYNGYVGIEKVTSNLKVMDAAQLRAYLAANGSSFSPNDDFNANTDWFKAIENQQGVSQNHNISFSGGNENSTYSASLNYFDKEGILVRSHLKRVIARVNLDQYALNKKVKFGLNISNSSSNANYVPLQNIVLLQAAKHLPVSPVKNADGSYFENLSTTGYFNPRALIDNAQDDTKYNTLVGGFTTEAKLPFGFTYNANLFYQKTTSLHGEYYNSYFGKYPTSNFYNNPDPGIGISHTLIGSVFGTNGSALRNTYQNTSTTVESYLTWAKKIQDHNITAVVGYSWQNNVNGDGFQASSTNFISDYTGYQNLGLGNPYAISSYRIQFGNDNYSQTKFISDFGRLNYSYKDKYLLQASVRRDGSSVFGANYHWGYFPSAGLAWRLIQEDFMKKLPVVSDLKLRASYGVTGNALGFNAYTAQLLFGNVGTYYNNGSFDVAYGPTQAQNPNLRWEKTSTTNIGLDFGVLKNKITGTFDWYDKKTTDMIFGYKVSAQLVPGGYIVANGGDMENKGIELTLNATPVQQTNFSWSTSVNIAHNVNTITALKTAFGGSQDSVLYSDPEGPGQTNSTLQILKVGKPLGQYFSLIYAGKNASGVSQFLKHDGTYTTAPTIRTDYWFVGSPQPKILLGWSNTLTYKNFDLNFFIRGVFGNKIFDATRADLFYVNAANINNISVDASADKITDTKNSSYSTRFIEDGSYVRLDNATLGYNFKFKSNYISKLRMYVSGNNLVLITKYKGIDPEVNLGGASPGVDYNNFYPKTRTFILGVNVSF